MIIDKIFLVLKILATLVIVLIGFFMSGFCFDSPSLATNIKLLAFDILICGIIIFVIWTLDIFTKSSRNRRPRKFSHQPFRQTPSNKDS